MKRIALVVPWVGPLPWYWDVWRRSAAERCFDVIVVRKTAAEFKALAERKLGTFVNLQAGYKLCDLKPMTGVLFEDWLKGYDYWAFGDCDVMYGRQFDAWIEKVVSGGYEVATVQQDFVAGFQGNTPAGNGCFGPNGDLGPEGHTDLGKIPRTFLFLQLIQPGLQSSFGAGDPENGICGGTLMQPGFTVAHAGRGFPDLLAAFQHLLGGGFQSGFLRFVLIVFVLLMIPPLLQFRLICRVVAGENGDIPVLQMPDRVADSVQQMTVMGDQ